MQFEFGKIKHKSFGISVGVARMSYRTYFDEDILAASGVVSPDAVADDVDVVEEPLVEVRPLSDRRQVLDQHLNLGHFQCALCSPPSLKGQCRYHMQSQCGGSKLEMFCEGADVDYVQDERGVLVNVSSAKGNLDEHYKE